jgi:phospholipase C
MKTNRSGIAWVLLALLALAPARPVKAADFDRIKHIVVIFQENRSFDNLYGTFPGADGIDHASPQSKTQVDLNGHPYLSLANVPGGVASDSLFPPTVPNGPWDIGLYAPPSVLTRDISHNHYLEIKEANGGMMNEFSTWSDDAAMPMGHYDYQTLPEAALAQEFTLCDHFFQGAYGASCLNHLYLIGGKDPGSFPIWSTVGQVSVITNNPSTLKDLIVSPAPGYFFVNSEDPTNPPHGVPPASGLYVPVLTYDTIGDRLSEKNITWKWYAENWDATNADPTGAIAGNFDNDHQPFDYFANYAPGTAARAAHLQDVNNFFADVQNHTLPSVVWIKPYATHDEHPQDGVLLDGQNYAMNLVNTLRNSPYWQDTLVIITYDESGGFWDHVAPPRLGDGHTQPGQVDEFGPGVRIPAILAGPFARKGYVAHEQFDTTSILKLIESRWKLRPLAIRDAAANNIADELDIDEGQGFLGH